MIIECREGTVVAPEDSDAPFWEWADETGEMDKVFVPYIKRAQQRAEETERHPQRAPSDTSRVNE